MVLLCTVTAFNVPRGVPNATVTGTESGISGLAYNTDSTLQVFPYAGINESRIAKRKYNIEDLYDFTDWDLDKLFPHRERERAYQYYHHIPGVIWIENNFFVDETEVSNIYWAEYALNHVTTKTNVSGSILPVDYFSNPKFRFYPVTRVNHDDVEKFCQWRTAVVTDRFNKMKGYKRTDPEYTVFRFRLPTRKEWERCAGYGMDLTKYPYGLKVLRSRVKFSKNAGEYLAEITSPRLSKVELSQKLNRFNATDGEDLLINCQRTDHVFLNFRTPFSVWSFPMNHFGIYNMLGNVAELVQERNVAKGGSWLSAIEDCQILHDNEFKGPADDVGFRTVCVLEWPNKTER